MKLCECGCGQPTALATRSSPRAGIVKGQPVRFVRGHAIRLRTPTWYPARSTGQGPGKVELLHRVRAERALGKPLPPRAVVHHADGSRAADGPLVICQDQAYHMLLHMRANIRRWGGDPNCDRRCATCKQIKPIAAFYPSHTRRNQMSGVYGQCRDCDRARRTRRTEGASA